MARPKDAVNAFQHWIDLFDLQASGETKPEATDGLIAFIVKDIVPVATAFFSLMRRLQDMHLEIRKGSNSAFVEHARKHIKRLQRNDEDLDYSTLSRSDIVALAALRIQACVVSSQGVTNNNRQSNARNPRLNTKNKKKQLDIALDLLRIIRYQLVDGRRLAAGTEARKEIERMVAAFEATHNMIPVCTRIAQEMNPSSQTEIRTANTAQRMGITSLSLRPSQAQHGPNAAVESVDNVYNEAPEQVGIARDVHDVLNNPIETNHSNIYDAPDAEAAKVGCGCGTEQAVPPTEPVLTSSASSTVQTLTAVKREEDAGADMSRTTTGFAARPAILEVIELSEDEDGEVAIPDPDSLHISSVSKVGDRGVKRKYSSNDEESAIRDVRLQMRSAVASKKAAHAEIDRKAAEAEAAANRKAADAKHERDMVELERKLVKLEKKRRC